MGWHIDAEFVEGVSIPFILVIIAISSRRIHKMIADTTD
jgi:uncharacterized membrane-anchored protein